MLWLASVVTALGVLGGVLWWLVWPRIEDKLSEVVASVAGVRRELADDQPDSVGRHAREAAKAAEQLPAIREQLSELARAQLDVDRWRGDVDRRLGGVEQVMVALAGPELRRRLFEDLSSDLAERGEHDTELHHHHHHHPPKGQDT